MPKGAELAPERIVGRYALYGEIASGGMATVHYGRLIGSVGFSRTVAIKRLHPQYAKDPEFASMFLDEARLAARIRHPNAVTTLDVVALEDELFLVMEYVQGEALSRLLRLQRATGITIPLPILGAIVCGALHGLHAAHEAKSERDEPLGIVHRDVSPQNVMVGIDGVARVLDFGVAKAAGRLQTTREGQIKGKLPYMAPEQIRGEELDRRVDVYAAAVVLWEALAGQPLFRGDNDGAVFAKVIEGAKVPPSTFRPGISADLDALVMRGLKRSPEARFATAREMAIALEEAMGLAPPRHVTEWIESIAGDSLAARAVRIKEIESASSGIFALKPLASDASEPSLASPEKSAVQILQAPARPEGDKVVEGQSQVSSISVSGNASAPIAKRSRVPLIAGGALAIALAMGATFTWMGERASSSGAPSVASPSPPPSAAPSIEPALPINAPTVIAAAASAPSALPINAPTSHKTPQSSPPRTTAPKPNCNPPFTVDSNGIKRPKSECL